MDDSSATKIRKNLRRIKEVVCVDLVTFVDELIQKDIFDMDIKDKLDSFRTPQEKSDHFIRMVVSKGPKACDEFILLLQEKKYEYVLFTREEVEPKGSGSREKTTVYRRESSVMVISHMEDKGACGEVQVAENSPKEMSTWCLKAKVKNTEEYMTLQNSYINAKHGLEDKRQKITELKLEKQKLEKKLEEANNKNKDLKRRNTELETKIGDQQMLLEKYGKEMSEIKEMLKEDREWRKQLDKEVNDNRVALATISDHILNMEYVRDKDPPNIDNSKRKQQFRTEAKPKSKNSNNRPLHHSKNIEKK